MILNHKKYAQHFLFYHHGLDILHCRMQHGQPCQLNVFPVASFNAGVMEYNPLTDTTYVFVPRKYYILKQVMVPSVQPAEVVQLAQMQCMKLAPLNQDEFHCFPRIVSHLEDGFSKVQIIMVKQSVFESEFISYFEQRGIYIDQWVFSFHFFEEVLRSNEQSYQSYFYKNGSYSEVGILTPDGQPLSRPVFDLPTENDELNYIVDSLEFFNSNLGGNESQLTLHHYIHHLEKVPEWVAAKGGKSHPFADIFSLSPSIDQTMENIAFKNSLSGQSRLRLKLKTRVCRWAVIGVVFVLLFLGGYHLQRHALLTQIEAVNAEISLLAKDAEWVIEASTQMQTLAYHSYKTDQILHSLSEIYTLAPPYINLSIFFIKSDNQVTLKGVSTEGTAGFMEALSSSPAFKNVQLKYQNPLKNKEIEFTIQCSLT